MGYVEIGICSSLNNLQFDDNHDNYGKRINTPINWMKGIHILEKKCSRSPDIIIG